MKQIYKVISFSLISLMLSFSLANASSGVFKLSHDLGFGKDTNLDAITKGRLFQVVIMTQNRLVRKNLKGKVTASLATKWSANSEANEWTFNLRKGIKFHDGSDFDAEDVKYSLMRVKDPDIGSPAKKSMSSVTDIEVIDSHTVKMKLNTSFADFPLLLTDYRLRMIPSGSGDTIGQTGIGTGPFKVATFDPEGTTVLKANPDYWEGAPGVAEVHVIAIPDGEARVQALLTGQFDMNRYVPFSQKKIFDGNKKFNVSVVPTGNWRGMVMRTDTAPFDDPKVRKAVRLAVDRQELVDLVMGGAATVSCDTPVAPSDQYRLKMKCPQDIKKAKKLLNEAGYPDGFDMVIHVSTKAPTWPTIGEVLQQQLAKAGIKAEVKMTPSKSYWKETWMKKPVAMTRWNERPADSILHEAYHSGAKWNESFFKNAAFDKNLSDARGELNFSKRKKAYQNAQKTLWEESGTMIPYHVSKLVITSSRVKNLDDVEVFSVRWHKLKVTD